MASKKEKKREREEKERKEKKRKREKRNERNLEKEGKRVFVETNDGVKKTAPHRVEDLKNKTKQEKNKK